MVHGLKSIPFLHKWMGDKFSAFLVDRDTEGFSIGAEEKKLGMKGSSTTPLIFQNAKVPVENLLYEVGKGATIAFNCLNIGRFKLGASGVGGSKMVISGTAEYAKERRAFGQSISHFDAIIKKIANMTIRTFAADSITYRTIGLLQNEINQLDKSDPDYYIKHGKNHGKNLPLKLLWLRSTEVIQAIM